MALTLLTVILERVSVRYGHPEQGQMPVITWTLCAGM